MSRSEQAWRPSWAEFGNEALDAIGRIAEEYPDAAVTGSVMVIEVTDEDGPHYLLAGTTPSPAGRQGLLSIGLHELGLQYRRAKR